MNDLNRLEQVLPAGTVEAAARRAEQMAERTGEFLRALGLAPSKPSGSPFSLPGEFLLELAAILQRADWQASGMSDSLDEELSPAFDDLRQLLVRLFQRPESFQGGDNCAQNARLSQQTLRLWLERFAWTSPELLECDMLLGDLNDDDLVDRLAEVLWARRHDLGTASSGDNP